MMPKSETCPSSDEDLYNMFGRNAPETLRKPRTNKGSMVHSAGEEFVCETSAVLFARRDSTPRTRHALDARVAWLNAIGRGSWTAADVVFMTALFAIFLLNMLDITITLIHIAAVGWAAEGNPLVRSLAEFGGAILPTTFKVIIISTAMYVMWRLYRETQTAMSSARTVTARRRAVFVLRAQMVSTTALFLLYAWIIQNNARITWG